MLQIVTLILANGARAVDNVMIILSDNIKSLLTALYVTTAQNRFSAAEADIIRVDGKQGPGSRASCGALNTLNC